jgi:hypothetical protein
MATASCQSSGNGWRLTAACYETTRIAPIAAHPRAPRTRRVGGREKRKRRIPSDANSAPRRDDAFGCREWRRSRQSGAQIGRYGAESSLTGMCDFLW